MIMNRTLFVWLVSGCLILPFTLNLVMLSKSLSVWFVFSQIVLLIAFFLFGNKVAFIKMPAKFYLSFVGISIFGILSGIPDLSIVINAFVFFIVACLVYLNASILLSLDDDLFEKIFKLFFVILLCFGLISLFIRLLNPILFEVMLGLNLKSIIFIGEHSMYAMLFGPIAIWYGHHSNKNFLVLMIILFFGITFPSAMMLSYGVVYFIFLLFFDSSSIVKKSIFLIFASLSITLVFLTQFNYFVPRLSTNSDVMNLSSLIYIAHWYEFWQVIFKGDFLGIGFGQTYVITEENDFVTMIQQIYGYEFTENGGTGHFYLSKLAISIGYGALIFLFLYIVGFFQSLKLYSISKNRFNSKSFIVIIGFLPELVLRTPGIISFGFFWLILGLCMLQHETNNKSRAINDRYS